MELLQALVATITSKYLQKAYDKCVLLLTNNGINVAVMITAKIIMTVSDKGCNVKLFLQSGNPQSVSKCFAKKGGDGWENLRRRRLALSS